MPHPKAGQLKRLYTAILTPFDLEGRLALEHMPTLLDFQRSAGIDGVVVCGTNGEGTSLSVAERKATLETVMAHRNGLSIIAGTGASSVTDAVDLTRHAAEVGVDGTLILPPFFFKNPEPAGLANYFRTVMDAADLPHLLYSIPQMTAVPIQNEVIDLLLDHPNLSGLKDSAGDWTRTQELITRYPQFRIFPGSDHLAAKGYANGAAGAISGGANAFPEVVAAVRDAADASTGGPLAEAAQQRLSALTDILRSFMFIAVNKSVLAHRGLPRLGVRPPIIPLTPAQEDSLLTQLKARNYL